ncbi:hypothetical protein BJ508DRAFT_123193 [Ascobolus immersus RN42]|uniref:Uncharacterized protein n=1 Tax=Ascobolus immersus RN42 TaxID=1160509 RepID=A0A3N4I9K9_ASCIM|nr:hypothetical protein BJ508DRAFT_123193 [Ascobolus immersus RN42]
MPCYEKEHRNQKHNLHGWSIPPTPTQKQLVLPCERICGYCLMRFSRREEMIKHLRNRQRSGAQAFDSTRCMKLIDWGPRKNQMAFISFNDSINIMPDESTGVE